MNSLTFYPLSVFYSRLSKSRFLLTRQCKVRNKAIRNKVIKNSLIAILLYISQLAMIIEFRRYVNRPIN